METPTGYFKLFTSLGNRYLKELSRSELFEQMMNSYKSKYQRSIIIFEDTLLSIAFEMYKKEYKRRYSKHLPF